MLSMSASKASEVDKAMILSEREACEINMVPGTTAIIATYNSNPRLFALSMLSLLAHSTHETLEHIIVVINGTDSRTGNTANQDLKQKFLEALREESYVMQYQSRDMPLTVMRIWSRLGHGQALDAAIAWVHTKNYLIMHDDVLVLSDTWGYEANNYLEDQNVGLVYADRLHILEGIARSDLKQPGDEESVPGITFPHPQTAFVAARKSRVIDLRWAGHFARKEFPKINLVDTEHFFGKHNEGWIAKKSKLIPDSPKFLSYDIGSYLLANLQARGYRFVQFSDKTMLHFVGCSWINKPERRKQQFQQYGPLLNEVELKVREKVKNLFNVYYDFFHDYEFCA